MKPATLARLDLLAAAREAQLVGEIGRHNAVLARVAQQRDVLAAYRDRLAGGWRAGVLVAAAFAQRGAKFVHASHGAEGQIDQFAEQARRQLDIALRQLAEVQARRRKLEETLRRSERLATRAADDRAAGAQPFLPKPGRDGGR